MKAKDLFQKQFISTRLFAFVVGNGVVVLLSMTNHLDPVGTKYALEALAWGFFGTKAVEGASYVAKNLLPNSTDVTKGGNNVEP
jgi:hypothetical protein